MATRDMWSYRDADVRGDELVGYEVEAVDGKIGEVEEAVTEPGMSFVVVDTGPWIFGRRSMLPAGLVERVDHERRHVSVDCQRDDIRDAPEFDESRYREASYRDELAGYYLTGPAARAFDRPL
jgi:hypothetical protein